VPLARPQQPRPEAGHRGFRLLPLPARRFNGLNSAAHAWRPFQGGTMTLTAAWGLGTETALHHSARTRPWPWISGWPTLQGCEQAIAAHAVLQRRTCARWIVNRPAAAPLGLHGGSWTCWSPTAGAIRVGRQRAPCQARSKPTVGQSPWPPGGWVRQRAAFLPVAPPQRRECLIAVPSTPGRAIDGSMRSASPSKAKAHLRPLTPAQPA